jgi:WD40 repeat protein
VFLPDGKRALAVNHQSVRLWDVTTGEEVRSIRLDERPHRQPVLGLALSPDGQHALTGAMDDDIILWKLSRE